MNTTFSSYLEGMISEWNQTALKDAHVFEEALKVVRVQMTLDSIKFYKPEEGNDE